MVMAAAGGRDRAAARRAAATGITSLTDATHELRLGVAKVSEPVPDLAVQPEPITHDASPLQAPGKS
jgi:hypothetical protein